MFQLYIFCHGSNGINIFTTKDNFDLHKIFQLLFLVFNSDLSIDLMRRVSIDFMGKIENINYQKNLKWIIQKYILIITLIGFERAVVML